MMFSQVWLCDNASFSQQDKCNEAVGAALDQKLSVWRSMEKNPPDPHLNSQVELMCYNNLQLASTVNKLGFFTL